MLQLMKEYTLIFPDVPKKTNAALHDVIVGDALPIKQHPYRLNPLKLQYHAERNSVHAQKMT